MTVLAATPARSRTVHDAAPSTADVRALAAGLRGRVLEPGSAAYDTAREGHNARYDRRPALIVRPVDATDVSRAILTARELGLEVAVKGGGHSIAGQSVVDGGLVIDLGDMRGVEIDPIRRTGFAQGGVNAGEYTAAAHQHGFATPFGDTASVGLGGLTLGGGIGWLVRKHGLTIDSVQAVQLVTADGRVRMVSEDEDPDLFWAVRGGGGNFGVATSFAYRLHPVDVITGGALILPATREVLCGLVPVAAAGPEELTMIAMVMPAPPAPFVPEAYHGKPVAIVMLVHAGDPASGAEAVEPFRRLATPVADLVGPMPYPAIYELTAEGEQRSAHVVRSAFMDELPDAAVDAILDRVEDPASHPAMVQLRVLGGAMGRVPADATAFAHRDASVMASIITPIVGEAAEADAWSDTFLADLAPRQTGVYSNFLGDEGDARIRAAYPGATYERLVQVKRRVDPDNVFHGNQNIRPY